MASHFRPEPNRFDPETRDYVPISHSSNSVNEEQFFLEADEYHSTLTPVDLRAAFEVIKATAARMVRQGRNVNTSLFKIRNSTRGRISLNGTSAPVESSVSLIPGVVLVEAAKQNIPVRTAYGPLDRPGVLFYADDLSGMFNRVATIGGQGQLIGERMRFDPSDPNQGVFLVDVESGEAFKAGVSSGSIEPGSMTITIPSSLVAGRTYALEVRSIFENTSILVTGRMYYTLIAQSASA